MDDSQNTSSGSEIPAQKNDPDLAEAEENGESISLKVTRFLRMCWTRRRMIFVILVIGTSISIVSALIQPNIYVSTTTLMPPDNASPYSSMMSLLSSSGAAASLGSGALGMEIPGELYVSILESRSVQDSLINRFNLISYYRSKMIEDARKSLSGDTEIEQDRKSGIISISVSATDPVFASKLAAGYVEEMNRVLTNNSTSAARRERIFLEGRVKDVNRSWMTRQRTSASFLRRAGRSMCRRRREPMMDVGLRLQAELIDGRSRVAALRQVYSEDSSKVRALEAHNAELQQQIDKMGGVASTGWGRHQCGNSGFPTAHELPALGLVKLASRRPAARLSGPQ